MDDLISRQALLKQIDIDSDGEPGYYGDTWKFIDTIKSMPSAELGTNFAEVGTDCISRQAAIDALDVLCQEHRYKIPGKGETYSQYNEAWQDALDRAEGAIFNLPPAQPKIIYCKDCKHHWTCKSMDRMPIEICDLEQTFYDAEHDFCNLAERRKNG